MGIYHPIEIPNYTFNTSLMPRCSVDIIRHRAEHLGTVVAANEKEAIKAAIATFQIEPARRNRITVTKISDRDDDEG